MAIAKRKKLTMGMIEIWTIVAIVLKLCGVGVFANWPIIASPFTWSCMCLELWVVMFYLFILVIYAVLKFICSRLSMANKIVETNLPAMVITEIDRHLTNAETKHPFFAASIIPARLCEPESIKVLLQKFREYREKNASVYEVLMQENYEIFEAIQNNDIKNARYEIYDSIAVLLRLDKVLQEKQRNEDFKKNDIPFYGKTKSES